MADNIQLKIQQIQQLAKQQAQQPVQQPTPQNQVSSIQSKIQQIQQLASQQAQPPVTPKQKLAEFQQKMEWGEQQPVTGQERSMASTIGGMLNPFAGEVPREQLSAERQNIAELGGLAGKGMEAANTLDDYVRSIAKNIPFVGGAADEFAATMNTATGLGDGDYEANLAQERQRDLERSDLARILGGATAAGITMPAAIGQIGKLGLGGKLLAGSALGAGSGGAEGFLEGQGGIENRLQEAGQGALLGGVLGGALPVAGAGVGKTFTGLKNVGQGVGEMIGSLSESGAVAKGQQEAKDMLAKIVAETSGGVDYIQNKLQDLGPDSILADIGGTLGGLGRGVAKTMGKSKDLAEGILENRRELRYDTLTEGINSLVSNKGFKATKNAIRKRQEEISGPLYKKAIAAVPILQSPKIDELLAESDLVKSAMRIARKDDYTLKKVPDNSMELFDRVYKYIGGKASQAYNSGDKERYYVMNKAKQDLKDELIKLNPAYKDALDAYSGEAALNNALDTGKKLFSFDEEDLAEYVSDLSSAEKDSFLVGAARALRNKVTSTTEGGTTGSIWGSKKKRNLVKEAIGDENIFNDFEKMVKNEIQKSKIEKGQSETAAILGEQAFAQYGPESVLKGFQVGGGDLSTKLIGATGAAARKIGLGPSEKANVIRSEARANELAKILFEQDEGTKMKMLDELRKKAAADGLTLADILASYGAILPTQPGISNPELN